jgi:peptidylprolyl isomerase
VRLDVHARYRGPSIGTVLLAALSIASSAAAQPIEPLRSARPAAPAAPADLAAAPATATKTGSGLAWKLLSKAQEGARPGPHDKVTLSFTGWTAEGKVIDSTVPDGDTRAYPMDDLTPGLSEGLRLMSKGERRRFWIPAELSSPGRPRKKGYEGPTVFDVELVDFLAMPDPMPVPEDVAAPPADAKRTKSGLAYKFLKHGKEKVHPTASNTVEVHYSGWTPDGRMFDSSLSRGRPTKFPLSAVIKGWTEGVQLLTVGDRARFWIPAALAYGDKPAQEGAPSGPLVFDIELVSIK